MPLRGRNLSNLFKSFIILSDLSKFERFGFGFPLLAADRWFPFGRRAKPSRRRR